MTQEGMRASQLAGIGLRRAREAVSRHEAQDDIEGSGWPRISDQIRAVLGAYWQDSAQTLAEKVGVSSDQLRVFLRGESGLRMDSIDRICRWLCVSLCDADGRELPDGLGDGE